MLILVNCKKYYYAWSDRVNQLEAVWLGICGKYFISVSGKMRTHNTMVLVAVTGRKRTFLSSLFN